VAQINKMDGDYSYIQVADAIAARIATGEFTIRLPAERALASEYDVAYQTVRRSMKVLRERGLIITRQGRGTFVHPSARVAPEGQDQPGGDEDD
jgi:DNA-binding GntR family transcriptional regulator